MRKVVAAAFVSLDGVMQAPGGPPEDPTGGFVHGGWMVNYWDEPMGRFMGETFSSPYRSPSRPQDLRDLRRALAFRRGR